MGTNYYWRFAFCHECLRSNRAHVGRSGFTWRAYRNVPVDPDHPEWGFTEESPFGFEVVSFADWRRVFNQVPGRLWDEYGKEVEDRIGWLAGMGPYELDDDRREWLEKDIESGDGWLDDEGYRFYAREFS